MAKIIFIIIKKHVQFFLYNNYSIKNILVIFTSMNILSDCLFIMLINKVVIKQ